MGAEEEIRELEEELKTTPYNKATQKHIGLLKAKLARLRAKPSKKGGAGLGYSIKKIGDATVILVGFPSVGKSTLLNALTRAESRVAEYDFTTLTVIPGVMEFRGAKIQVLDIPGIIEAASEGKGRGREVLSVIRNADLLLVMVAGEGWERQKEVIENELYQAGFRLNARPPEVRVEKRSGGGLRVDVPKTHGLSPEAVKEVLREFRILNAEVVIRERISLDQLIDCLLGNRVYVPAVFVLNKSDLFVSAGKDVMKISALKKEGVEELKEVIWDRLGLKRVYLKKPGKEADREEPLILRGSPSVREVCQQFNLLKYFKGAKIWGPSARFPGQKVGLGHKLEDGDIVEIHD